MVDCTGLENRQPARVREFESHRFRQNTSPSPRGKGSCLATTSPTPGLCAVGYCLCTPPTPCPTPQCPSVHSPSAPGGPGCWRFVRCCWWWLVHRPKRPLQHPRRPSPKRLHPPRLRGHPHLKRLRLLRSVFCGLQRARWWTGLMAAATRASTLAAKPGMRFWLPRPGRWCMRARGCGGMATCSSSNTTIPC